MHYSNAPSLEIREHKKFPATLDEQATFSSSCWWILLVYLSKTFNCIENGYFIALPPQTNIYMKQNKPPPRYGIWNKTVGKNRS